MSEPSTAAQLEALLPTEDELAMLRQHPLGTNDAVDRMRMARVEQFGRATAVGLTRDELDLLLAVWRGAVPIRGEER